MYDELVKRLRNRRICIQQLGTLNDYPLLGEAADAIEELMRRCEQFQYMPPPAWIPVTERLPEPFESVLVCYQREGRYGTSCGHYYIDRGTTIWKASGIIPTHWMPLPEPPKGE